MKKLGLLVICFWLTGCAVFEGGKLPKAQLESAQNDHHEKQSVEYSSLALGGLTSTDKMPEMAQSIIEGELADVLESSDYFSRISKKDDAADIHLDITLKNHGDPAAMIPAIITGASLYTIPSWATDNFDVVAIVERKDGLKKEYRLTDSTKLVQWLPMIFLFPVQNFSVVTDVRKNIYTNLLVEMKNDGFFNKTVEK